MSLVKQPLPVPFAQGIDTKSDPKQVSMGKLLEAENVTFNRGGSLTKRAGFRKVAPIAESVLAQGSAQTLLTLAQERLVVAGHQLHSYSPAARSWTAKGPIRSLGQTTTPVYADAFEQTCPDLAITNGVSLSAFQTTEAAGAIRVVLTDEATGARLYSLMSPDSLASNPRCVACGPWLYCFYTYATGNIGWVRYSSAQPDAAHAIASLLNTGTGLPSAPTDVWEVIETGGALVLAYFDATFANLNVMWLTPDPATGFLLVGDPSNGYPVPYNDGADNTGCIALAMAASPGHIGVAWSVDDFGGAGNLLGVTLDHQLVETRARGKLGVTPAGPNVARVGLTYSELLGSFYVVFEVPGALPYNTVTYNTRLQLTGSAIGTTQTLFRSLGLASYPFVQDGQIHVWLVYDGGPLSPQNTVFLCTVAIGSIVLEAKALAGRAAGLATAPSLPRPCQGEPGVWSTAMGARNLFKVGLNSEAAFTKNAERVTLDFTREGWDSAELAKSLHVAGAQVHGYDGLGVVEQGFPIVPEVGQTMTGSFTLSVKTKPGAPITVEITPPPDDVSSLPARFSGAQIEPSSYLILWDTLTLGLPSALVIWFAVDGVGTDLISTSISPSSIITIPLFPLSHSVRVDVTSSDTQDEVASKINVAILNDLNNPTPDLVFPRQFPNYTPGDGFLTVQSGGSFGGGSGIGFPIDSTQMGYDVVIRGESGVPGTAERTFLTFPAGRWISSGQWFQLESDLVNSPGPGDIFCFYFVVDAAAPSPVPSPGTSVGFVPIAINSTDSAAAVATAVGTAISGTLTSSVHGAHVYFDQTTRGPLVDVTPHPNGPGSHGTILLTSVGSTGIRNNNVGGNVEANPGSDTLAPTPASYNLFAIYEWTDSQGQYHRSGPSAPMVLNVGAKDGYSLDDEDDPYNSHRTHATIQWTVSTLRCSRKKNVQIGLFRTQKNLPYAKRIATIPNDPTADSVSFKDPYQDSYLESAETLYTHAGEVANEAPPAAQGCCSYQGRIMLGGIDSDPLAIWPSKALGDGFGVAFSSLLSLRVSNEGGSITALAVMDEKLIIFKAGRIYVLSGDGPNSAAQGTFSVPVELTTDEGCSNPASVVLTDAGLLFQGQRGICLLSRELAVSYIGAPAEKFGQLTITSALTLPAVHQVRWTTKEGPSLVYDTFYEQWGTNTYKGLAARVWAGLYTVLRADGAVLVETPGLYTDDGVPVQLRVSTAWIKPAQVLQGFGRVYRVFVLGQYKSQHRLRMQAAYDYNDGTLVDLTFNAKEVLGSNAFGSSSPMGAGSPFGDTAAAKQYQFRAYPHFQKCQAIRITLTDLDSGAGESCSLAELALEVGVKAGSYKLPNKNSVG